MCPDDQGVISKTKANQTVIDEIESKLNNTDKDDVDGKSEKIPC